MDASLSPRRLGLVLVLCLFFGGRANVYASTYYNVTDLGNNSDVKFENVGNSTAVTNTQTGVSYAIPFSQAPLPAQGNLPGVEGVFGTGYPGQTKMFFPMQPFEANNLGTVVGGVPSGDSLAVPYSTLTLGYAEKQPNGQYGSFVGLADGFDGWIQLNARNQILVHQGYLPGGVAPPGIAPGTELIDLNNHTAVSVDQLIPPGILPVPNGYFTAESLFDNGAIFASEEISQGHIEDFLLTPPGMPSPVPEPTTIAMVGIVFGCLIIRRQIGLGSRPVVPIGAAPRR